MYAPALDVILLCLYARSLETGRRAKLHIEALPSMHIRHFATLARRARRGPAALTLEGPASLSILVSSCLCVREPDTCSALGVLMGVYLTDLCLNSAV